MTRNILLALALCLLPSCITRATEYCEAQCECEDCSDQEYDICVIRTQENIDTASAYDCSEEVDLLADCYLAFAVCEDRGDQHEFEPDSAACQEVFVDVTECYDDASSLDDFSGGSGEGS